uniref:XK-related protein 6-like n=1 Tax=Myxine glutinosa TaxID=7769 RepID=UPI00358F2AC9
MLPSKPHGRGGGTGGRSTEFALTGSGPNNSLPSTLNTEATVSPPIQPLPQLQPIPQPLEQSQLSSQHPVSLPKQELQHKMAKAENQKVATKKFLGCCCDGVSYDHQERNCAENNRACCRGKSKKTSRPCPMVEVMWLLLGLVTLLANAGTDAFLAVDYLSRGDIWCFHVTLGFTLLPSLLVQAFSLRWLAQDECSTTVQGDVAVAQEIHDDLGQGSCRCCRRGCLWTWRIILHFCQLSMEWRQEMQQPEAAKCKRLRALRYEYTDVSLLRLLLAVLHSGPQLLFQLCLLVQRGQLPLPEGLCVTGSLLSMAWAVTAYHKALHDLRDDKQPVACQAAMTMMFWHLFTAASRALAFALFASLFPLYFGLFLVTHWCLVTFWVIHIGTDFCTSKWEEILCDMVVGLVCIFTWFEAGGGGGSGSGRCCFTTFQCLLLTENGCLAALWFLYRGPHLSHEEAFAVLCLVFASFAAGIGFMLTYYTCLHSHRQCCHGDSCTGGPHFPGCSCLCCCHQPSTAEVVTLTTEISETQSSAGVAVPPVNGTAVSDSPLYIMDSQPMATPERTWSLVENTSERKSRAISRASQGFPSAETEQTLTVTLDSSASTGPIFQVRPTIPASTAVSRHISVHWPPDQHGIPLATLRKNLTRRKGQVIRIDMPRKKYPAWDAHLVDRRLRRCIRTLEHVNPGVITIRYREDNAPCELAEYETTV